MEIERPTCQAQSELFVELNSDYVSPKYFKITFELPADIGEMFLKYCDKKKKDPDLIVAQLIKQWIEKRRQTKN